ncbi:MAG: amidohydrolase family protein [Acidobacteria bacterium]|nr:amidohydrolase family protein [Acidobacteriota bacterium]
MKRTVHFSLVVLLSAIFMVSCQMEDNRSVTALKVGLLIDGTGNPPRRDVVVLIEGDSIIEVVQEEEIPAGAVVVDASQQVVIPGLIDTHVHLGERAIAGPSQEYAESVYQHLKQNLAFGVTTIVSLGMDTDSIFALRDKSWEDAFGGARILTTGTGFTSVGGHPTQLGTDLPNQIDDPAQARERVQELAAQGVDGLKIWFARSSNLPPIKTEVARAIIEEGHLHNLRVFAHLNTAADTRILVEAKLDGITHIARDPYDEETLELMQRQGTIVAPTLVQREKDLIFTKEKELFEDPVVRAILGQEVDELKETLANSGPEVLDRRAQSYQQAKENVMQLKNAGVKLAVGTDSGTNLAPMGLVTHKEIEALVDAGLSPMEALVAGTRGSAEWAGVSDRVGTIEAGKLADLLILEESPLENIRNTRKIVKIMLGGRILEPLAITQ